MRNHREGWSKIGDHPAFKLYKQLEEQDTIIKNLKAIIRRLEKSNEKLGLELHKLKGEGTGWNKNSPK